MLSVLSSCRFVFMESPDPSLVLLCEIGSTEVVFDLNNARGLYLLSMVILSASEEQNIIQLTSRLQFVSTKASCSEHFEEDIIAGLLVSTNVLSNAYCCEGFWPTWLRRLGLIVSWSVSICPTVLAQHSFVDICSGAQESAMAIQCVLQSDQYWLIDFLLEKNIQHFRQHFGACYSRFQQCPAFWAPVCCCATVAREPSSHKANSGGLIRKLIVQWNTRDTETMQTKKL